LPEETKEIPGKPQSGQPVPGMNGNAENAWRFTSLFHSDHEVSAILYYNTDKENHMLIQRNNNNNNNNNNNKQK
jgi:hypothetical protein